MYWSSADAVNLLLNMHHVESTLFLTVAGPSPEGYVFTKQRYWNPSLQQHNEWSINRDVWLSDKHMLLTCS